MSRRKKITYDVTASGCHVCTSHALGSHGYPCLWKDGRNQNMHRVLYEEKHGKIPDGQLVRHACDVRACINMDHLVAGTSADNTADITERNRHNPPVGERAGNCVVPTASLKDIRSSKETQRALAARYEVSQSTISRIISKKRRATA